MTQIKSNAWTLFQFFVTSQKNLFSDFISISAWLRWRVWKKFCWWKFLRSINFRPQVDSFKILTKREWWKFFLLLMKDWAHRRMISIRGFLAATEEFFELLRVHLRFDMLFIIKGDNKNWRGNQIGFCVSDEVWWGMKKFLKAINF